MKYQYKITDTGLHQIVRYNDDESITYIPCSEDNTDYAEIMKLVEAGELTIAPAEGDSE